LIDLINKKRAGTPIAAKASPKAGGNVINLMDALKKSLANDKDAAPAAKKVAKEPVKETVAAKAKKPKKRVEGQREMLLPISGKGGKDAAAKEAAPKKVEKPVRATTRTKKAG
jgi:DNA end-binding protein Ku